MPSGSNAELHVSVSEGKAPFCFIDERFLTRQRFVDEVRKALHQAGIDQPKYCGHSFCIGAATTTATRGMEDSLI